MLHVPYKSAPPALKDLLAGRVSMMFTDFTTGIPHVQANTLARAGGDAASSAARCFPSCPPWTRPASTGFDMDSWAGLFAPADTPPDDRHAAQHRAAQDHRQPGDEGEARATSGFEAFSSSPKELDDFVKVQLGKWGKMIKDAGIQPE